MLASRRVALLRIRRGLRHSLSLPRLEIRHRGNCVEQPFEPVGSTFKDRIKHRAYPVQVLGGVLFVYMGPAPAPLLPRWDVLAWPGHRKVYRWAPLACNWLQIVENSIDITHTYYLTAMRCTSKGRAARASTTSPANRAAWRPALRVGHREEWTYVGNGTALGDEIAGGTPMVFPRHGARAGVPVAHATLPRADDDTTTQVFWIGYLAAGDPTHPFARTQCAPDCQACARESAGEQQDPEAPFVHDLLAEVQPDGEYAMNGFFGQDRMAWETAGPIADRSAEHLGTSDRGVIMSGKCCANRSTLRRRGATRSGRSVIPRATRSSNLPAWVTDVGSGRSVDRGGVRASAATMAAVFDERHESIVINPASPVFSTANT